jgi:uncharacterized protein (DUF362 family)
VSDVLIASETANTKCRFVESVLAQYAETIKSHDTVFIKPNLASDEPYPTTTDPQVLDVVLSFLSGHQVAVGDGPAYDYSLRGDAGAAAPDHPLLTVCRDHGVEWINLNKRLHVNKAAAYGLELALSDVPRSFDVTISLPVLKRHITCTMTGAVKKSVRLARFECTNGHASHVIDINKGIAAIAALERCSLFIVDAVETLLVAEEVRHGGKKAHLGYMLAGTDPVAIDGAGFDLLKSLDRSISDKTARDVAHLAYAADYRAGDLKYSLIEFRN